MSVAEIDAISIDAEISEDETVIFNQKDYVDKNGIRLFIRPLKVPSYIWAFSISYLNSSVYMTDDTETVYVFVMSLTKEDNIKLAEEYSIDSPDNGYGLMPGYSKEEVMCID
jgi:hypothetical protein